MKKSCTRLQKKVMEYIALASVTLAASLSYASFPPLPPTHPAQSPAEAMAITRMLNNIFFPMDALFPTPSAQNSSQLNTITLSERLASTWTQNVVNTQLQTIPNTIAQAYNHLSANHFFTTDVDADAAQNQITALTAGKPSFDTFFLPSNILCLPSDEGCSHKPDNDQLQQNANNFSFDAFFTPSHYSITDGGSTAQNYITYTLQTYQPLAGNALPSSNTSSGDQNQTFFQMLSAQLQNDPKKANSFLIKNVINNPQFQQYWADLRALEAKNSLILSNFNFLAAERTAQKGQGLGTAYHLKDEKGAPISDASPLQVEQYLVNSTVYNPTWYNQMKTAPLATLQRQQLLLTALLVRLQYHNEMINERNLATQLILAGSLLQQSKLALQQEEAQLKTAIFPSNSNTTDTSQMMP